MQFTHKMNTIMGQNKDAVIGFVGIGIIIAIIVGVVTVLFPGEPETVQNTDVVKPNNIEFDPITVEQYEKVFPFFQDSFRLILKQCHAVDSYTDYLGFGESIPWMQNGFCVGTEILNDTFINLEKAGYNNHPTVEPIIKATRVLMEKASDCIIDLQDKYEKNLETEYLKELDNEFIEKTKQLTKADYEILDSKKEIEFDKEYQSDIWSLLSIFREDSTKEQILADKISRLKTVTLGNYEELEYLKEDLNSATSGYERTSIKSEIKFLQSIIDYDKQKIIDLENHGISALEEYAQDEIQELINKHLERIQRLENLNSKNLGYLNTDEGVLQYVSNYQGIDNKGNTLQTEVESFIKEKYGYDALTENNPFLKDNWVKTNTVFYFGTEAIDDFSVTNERYKVVRYAFFYPLQGEYKTILGFGFDTETYEIVADDENSVKILSKLNHS